LPFTLVSVGQQTVTVGLAGILNATTPLWTVLLTVALGQRPATSQVVGVVVGFAGVSLVLSPWRSGGPLGAGAVLVGAAAASYAVAFVLMSRRLVPSGATPGELAATQMLAAAALSGLALLAHPGPEGDVTVVALAAVLALGAISTALTFWIAYRMLAADGPTNTAVVGYLLPVVAVILGVLFVDERLTVHATAGTAVILTGVALTRR
jgi:drug/metabolite transporter (DMT)-like permease